MKYEDPNKFVTFCGDDKEVICDACKFVIAENNGIVQFSFGELHVYAHDAHHPDFTPTNREFGIVGKLSQFHVTCFRRLFGIDNSIKLEL